MAITEEQRRARRSGIGSSDAPKILGLDPYSGPADVLAEKLGLVEPDDRMSEAAGWGTLLEPVVLEAVSRSLGRRIVPGGDPWRRGVLFAHLDGQLDERKEGNPPVEAKCVFQPSRLAGYRRNEDGPQALPERVLVQVQHQILCVGAEQAYVGVLYMGDDGEKAETQVYHVPRDDRVCGWLENTLTCWWDRYVVRREKLDETPGMDTLARILRVPGKSVVLDGTLVERYWEAKRAAESAEKALEQAKAELIHALGDAEIGSYDDGRGAVTYRQICRTSLDTRALENDHPELVSRYVRQTRYRRLVVNHQGGNRHDD